MFFEYEAAARGCGGVEGDGAEVVGKGAAALGAGAGANGGSFGGSDFKGEDGHGVLK